MGKYEFPRLPKGYTWSVKYQVRYGNPQLRVAITRWWGLWTVQYRWHVFSEDTPPFKSYYPSPEEIRTVGAKGAEHCWKAFNKVSMDDQRRDAAASLMDSLNAGSL